MRLSSFLLVVFGLFLVTSLGCGIERTKREGLPPEKGIEQALQAGKGELVRVQQPQLTAPQWSVADQEKELAPNIKMLQSRYLEARVQGALNWRVKINQSIEVSLRELGRLLKHPQPQTRLAAAEVLTFAYDPRAAPVLAIAAKDADPLVRQTVAEGMGLLGGPVAMETVLELTRDPDAWVRKSAAAALSLLPKEPQAQKRLIEMLTDPDGRVRELTAESLALVGGADAVPSLMKALESDTEPMVRQYAASALGSIEAKEAVPVLIKALHDPVEDVRWACARAIGFCAKPGDETAVRALRDARANDVALVRFAAELSLRKLGYTIVVEPKAR